MSTVSTSGTSAPSRPQHLAALEKANHTRLARADLKRRIKDGEISVAAILRDRPEIVSTMALGELLRAQWRWSRVRSQRVCGRAGVYEVKRIGTLTDRQARLIIDLLGGA